MTRFFLFLLAVAGGLRAQDIEGSGEDTQVDEYWLQSLIETVESPRYLMQKAYQAAANAKTYVDEEEILTLDASVPEHARNVFVNAVSGNLANQSHAALENATNHLMAVVYHAFRPFGCDQDNIWPSVYNLTRDNLYCVAFNLLDQIYLRSEFTRKYFARAVHFGITSKAPIDHRIHEMGVYQFLLPNGDRVWFNNLKITFKNTFWNEQQKMKSITYEDNSFQCGSIPFTDEVQHKIDFYYPKLKQ